MFRAHFKSLSRNDLALDLDCPHCVSQSILLSIVFRLDFFLSLLIFWVDIFVSLSFGGLLFLFLTFTAYTFQNSLRIAGKRESVKIVGVWLIKLIKLGKGFEVKLVSRVVKGFVRECVMPFEINAHCDIVRCASREYLSPK